MNKDMRAMVVEAPGKMVFKRVPIPEIGPKDILFKVSYAAICGGDLPAFKEGRYIQKYPITIGHEFTGYVVKVGSEVKDIPVGMRFMGTNIEWCGECEHCKSGNNFSCEDVIKKGLGFGRDGVFAEYSVIHNAMLGISVNPLPDNINDLEGATCEPMCVGAGVTDMLGAKDGDKIVVYGAGIIGQSFIQTLKAQYDCTVAVVNRSPFRLELSKESGADITISPTREKPAIDQLRELWGTSTYPYHYNNSESGNADIAIECTGNPEIVAECFRAVRNGGTVCLAAGYADDYKAPIAPADLFFKNIHFVPGLGGNFAKSVKLMSEGKFKTTHLITHVYPLEQLEEAMQKATDTKNSCKVCIKVDPDAPDFPYNKQD